MMSTHNCPKININGLQRDPYQAEGKENILNLHIVPTGSELGAGSSIISRIMTNSTNRRDLDQRAVDRRIATIPYAFTWPAVVCGQTAAGLRCYAGRSSKSCKSHPRRFHYRFQAARNTPIRDELTDM